MTSTRAGFSVRRAAEDQRLHGSLRLRQSPSQRQRRGQVRHQCNADGVASAGTHPSRLRLATTLEPQNVRRKNSLFLPMRGAFSGRTTSRLLAQMYPTQAVVARQRELSEQAAHSPALDRGARGDDAASSFQAAVAAVAPSSPYVPDKPAGCVCVQVVHHSKLYERVLAQEYAPAEFRCTYLGRRCTPSSTATTTTTATKTVAAR